MTVAEKILNLRKNSGLSQEAFAQKLGVSRQSVSKWESGSAVPDIDKIVGMSEIFGVSTDYLLKDDEAQPSCSSSDDTAEIPVIAPANEIAEQNQTSTERKRERKKPSVKAVVACVLALCIIVTAIGVPVHFGGIKETWWAINGGKIDYPYVLVHGLGGWGEGSGINGAVQYWGATSGNLVTYLESEGYEVHAPSVGPVSSAWDRACELYAQLTGTTVDYGEAHSKEHNHARYGRTYTQPLVENRGEKLNGGQRQKINLIGHSFGGATVRLLTSLLEYGSEAEQAVGGEISPLFEGGKGDWVNSITTLCAPHNGSSLINVMESIGSVAGVENTTDMIAKLCFIAAGVAEPADGVYDFMLDQFGIGKVEGDLVDEAIEKVTKAGNDHAGYDLSPDGAAELNKTIKVVEDVYYFSYAYSTTQAGTILGGQVPKLSTLIVLQPTALAMGSYKGTTKGGIVIDESWQENDGLVSVISAKKPTNDEGIELEYDVTKTEDVKDIERGVWYISPTKDGDHGTVIGLGGTTEKTNAFYIDLFTLVDSLKR